jgi:N-acyl-D-amino-acid deacylase
VLASVHQEARTNRDRIPDPAISVSYALIGLAAQQYPRSEVTDTMARVIAAWQNENGAFSVLPAVRPPIEADAFTATTLSLRALQLYGTRDDDARVARAGQWLRTATPRTMQERAMQILGLAWTNAPVDTLRASSMALLALQQADGGWSQLPTLETDAYATGQALVALQAAGQSVSSPEYRRGVAFLLRTQFPDGSWLVRTRTFPVQPPKDSGFPHGKHQWISAAGTSWAALALAVSLPPRELPTDPAHGLR